MPSTIHSAVAPMEVTLAGGVMPMLVVTFVVLFNIEQKPWLVCGAQTSTVMWSPTLMGKLVT